MGRFFMGALALVACGKVSDTPPTSIVDAALDAFSCTTPMLACGGTCVDPMSDMANCGGCGTTCQANSETCQAGECADTIMTCAEIRAENPTASDGAYTLVNGTVLDCDMSGGTCAQMHTNTPAAPDGVYTKLDGTVLYCDMSDGGVTIYGLVYGLYSTVTGGYSMVSLANYESPGLQQVFIALFNKQAGVPVLGSFSIGDCCIKFDASTTNFLQLGSGAGSASWVDVGQCVAAPPAVATIGVFLSASGQPTAQSAPLPTTFFQTFAPTVTTQICSNATNPAYFWKETP